MAHRAHPDTFRIHPVLAGAIFGLPVVVGRAMRVVGEYETTEQQLDGRRDALTRTLYEAAQAVGRGLADSLGLEAEDAAQEAALVLADCTRRMHRASWPQLRRAVISRMVRDSRRRQEHGPDCSTSDDDEDGWRGCPTGLRIKSAGGALLDRAWMFADLRCPQCGSRGHWETWSAALDARECADEDAEAARTAATWTERQRGGTVTVPRRKPKMGDVWVCGRATCRAWTYEPRAKAQGADPEGLDCYPGESHAYAPHVDRTVEPPEASYDPTEHVERMIDARLSRQQAPATSSGDAHR